MRAGIAERRGCREMGIDHRLEAGAVNAWRCG
jgi:hypothetical protein